MWSLLLAWLPVIGDPLTLVAGLLRAPLPLFLLLVTIGKRGRYVARRAGICAAPHDDRAGHAIMPMS